MLFTFLVIRWKIGPKVIFFFFFYGNGNAICKGKWPVEIEMSMKRKFFWGTAWLICHVHAHMPLPQLWLIIIAFVVFEVCYSMSECFHVHTCMKEPKFKFWSPFFFKCIRVKMSRFKFEITKFWYQIFVILIKYSIVVSITFLKK